jgi:hypothetical protein
MPNNSFRWEPDRNAVHRLIQLLDVLAITFNRFRQLSFYLPTYDPPHQFDTAGWQASVERIRSDFAAIRGAMFNGYGAPARRAERLADEAVAEFARAGARDEATLSAVADAARWIGTIGTSWQVNTPRPWDYGVRDCNHPEHIEATKSREERFEGEFTLLLQYGSIRRGLLSALARIGQTVPPEIDKREAITHYAWPKGGSDPITQAELLALLRETEPSVAPLPSEQSTTAPPDPPAEPNTDLTRLRLRCYPPVPLGEMRPRRPEPPDSEIITAMRTIPVALTESRFGSPQPHLPASSCEHCLDYSAWLAFAQERGHGRAAAEWAVYRLVQDGRLYVVWPEVRRLAPLTVEQTIEQAERYRGRPATVTDWDLFDCGRILQIRSLPALWKWFRNGCPCSTSTAAPHASPPADVPLSAGTIATARGMVAHLRELSTMNTAVGDMCSVFATPELEIVEVETPGKPRSKGVPLEEAEILVRDWLAKHAKENPAAVTRDAVATGTGVSAGQVSKTAAWQAFRDRRDAEAKPEARDVPLTDTMKAIIPADCDTPAELAALIEEQKAEEAEQERRHKRRHGSS